MGSETKMTTIKTRIKRALSPPKKAPPTASRRLNPEDFVALRQIRTNKPKTRLTKTTTKIKPNIPAS